VRTKHRAQERPIVADPHAASAIDSSRACRANGGDLRGRTAPRKKARRKTWACARGHYL